MARAQRRALPQRCSNVRHLRGGLLDNDTARICSQGRGRVWRRESALSYADKSLACRDCGQAFVFSSGEQEFFAQKGFTNEPSRCPDCRSARKASGGGGGGDSSGGYGAGGLGAGGGGGWGPGRGEVFSPRRRRGHQGRPPLP